MNPAITVRRIQRALHHASPGTFSLRAGIIRNNAVASGAQDDLNQTSMEDYTMKRILGTLAVLSLLVAAGCTTTGTAPATHQGVVASVSNAPLECVPGWNACVCGKESRCCKVRMDCNCSSSGEASCS